MIPSSHRSLSGSVIAAAGLLSLPGSALAQYTAPPPPAPFQGFLNEALRKDDPYMNAWDIRGFARVRYEIQDGRGIPTVPGSLDFREHNTDNHNAYFLELFRVQAGYTATWWSALVEGRSSLAQGDERFAFAGPPRSKGKGPESDTIDLHQAYVTLGNHKEFPLSLKVGRQELSYADERFIGSFIWNNVNRVFDAAKLRWQNPWFAADFFTGMPVVPVDGAFNHANDYEHFSGMYATSTKVPKHGLDVFVLARNVDANSTKSVSNPQAPLPSPRDIYSLGVCLRSKPGELGPWDYFVNAVGQLGDFLDNRPGAPTQRLDHEAYAIILNGGYTFTDCPATPRFAIEYSFGSGDSNPRDDSHGTFEQLYPTAHKFNGYADYASLQNAHDIRPILQFKPTPRMSVAIEGHAFWMADTSDSFYTVGGLPRGGIGTTAGNGYGINPGYSSFIGTEIDVIAGYALTRYASLEAGFCHFFAGDYIESSLSNPNFGARDANFIYLSALLKF
jgi:hypothetical protein